MLRRALEREGYQVSVANDGEQALNLGMLGGMDAMILDVMLPYRDGFEVIQTLRQAKQLAPAVESFNGDTSKLAALIRRNQSAIGE